MPSRQLVVRLRPSTSSGLRPEQAKRVEGLRLPLALSVVEGLAKNTYQELPDDIAGIYDSALRGVSGA